jgi:hypothetical protein
MMRRRVIAIALITTVALALPARASAQKLIFLVCHAERADAGATPQTDPPLSSAGQARAQKLAAMLADAGITSISHANLFIIVPATGTVSRLRY